ncbi:MAG TPA: DUF2264 domain-containing protein [Cyclobacteriaceae bacterium]|jgi:hypothetical protein|nr:DUF2264 domain-containing protein [Cyclobacteriaceae bacterium]
MVRRHFLRGLSLAGLSGLINVDNIAAEKLPAKVMSDRDYWVSMLTKITQPVLQALSEGRLKKSMPIETAPGLLEDRRRVTHLEALGRSLAGLAPWLELGPDATEEGKLREQFIYLASNSIKNAVTPSSPDYMNFSEHGQPLVDTAFLAHALIRAPKQLWGNLDSASQQNLINALSSTRSIKPPLTNWLLFSAMIETALLKFTSTYNKEPVELAIQKHEEWYKGDAVYGDGPEFAYDYYNSFVIQPMLLDVVRTFNELKGMYGEELSRFEKRAVRYAEIQERNISPEGAFPPTGRSIAYRCGAFQLLSQMALQKKLPSSLPPEQVRSALTAVIKRSIEAPGTFDQKGWLTIGFCGHQPEIGEHYISTGSLYLCTVAFLPLGLPQKDDFWSGPPKAWTSLRAYSGKSFPIDHALKSHQ